MSAGKDFMAAVRALTRAREQQGKAQAEIAQRCRVSRQAVSNWESGVNVPTADKLALWADALGMRLAVLPAEVTP